MFVLLILFISLLLKFPFLASVSEALPLDFSDEKTLADSSQKKRPRMTPRMSTTNDNVRLLILLFCLSLVYSIFQPLTRMLEAQRDKGDLLSHIL